jgi:hypothetical protein
MLRGGGEVGLSSHHSSLFAGEVDTAPWALHPVSTCLDVQGVKWGWVRDG